MSANDARDEIYADLHGNALQALERQNRISADLILPLLFERYRPRSVLDVGCGLGTWLAAAKDLGVAEIRGIEGAWLDRKLARIPAESISTLDLERPFDLQRRFDLVMTMEVAEHLSPQAAEGFVDSLVRHGDVVLFSAAIPHQGGSHHVNEQFPDYWDAFFSARGYVALDFIRPQIWYAGDVLVWLRQNLLVFAKEELASGKGPFADVPGGGALSVVHPEVWMSLIDAVSRREQGE